MKEIRLEGLKALLQPAKRIVVTNHVNPDGDAMGSALGLSIALKALGHSVHVVVPNDYPEFLKWMAGTAEVIVAENQKDLAQKLVSEAEIIFHLDYNAYSRAGVLEQPLREAKALKVLIDHHRQPESWPDFIYSDIQMSSTSQMIYEWLAINGWQNRINKEAAECLYTGIVTDTGSFRFSSTTARTHTIAAEFMQLGVKPDEIYNRVFDNNSVSRLKLLGTMLEHMRYFPEKNAVILFLRKADQDALAYSRGDSEGFVNYGLSIGDVKCSIFLREDADSIKVSLRSKGEIDVNKLAREKFNGGGHVNAAGGNLEMNLNDALAYAENVISEYQSMLTA